MQGGKFKEYRAVLLFLAILGVLYICWYLRLKKVTTYDSADLIFQLSILYTHFLFCITEMIIICIGNTNSQSGLFMKVHKVYTIISFLISNIYEIVIYLYFIFESVCLSMQIFRNAAETLDVRYKPFLYWKRQNLYKGSW